MKKKQPPHFGHLVRERRGELDLSLFQLGVKTGLHPQTISQLERKGSCSLKKAMVIAAALDLEVIPVYS